MGHSRPRPKHLAAKLLQIRQRLGLSQSQIAKQIGVLNYTDISKYELNRNEPPLAILLGYSRAANIPLEQIVDDQLDLELR
jgi:transcriptional regulator with XRE-family HTH domain